MASQVTCKRLDLQSIARAILGRSSLRHPAFMAVLSAYLDASGSANDPACHFLTVAGYVATDEQWKRFEDDWQIALSEAGLTHFHAKNYAHSRGEFESWKSDEKRRRQLIERLTHIIKIHNLEDFSISVHMRDYRNVDRVFQITETFGAYAIAASTIMGKIASWQRKYRPDDSLLFLFEKGDNQQESLRRLVRDNRLWEGQEPIFLSKKVTQNGTDVYCLPLQASDFLAYEHAKSLTEFFVRGKRTGRTSLYRLRYGSGVIPLDPPMWMHLDVRFLMSACALYHIPKRR